MCGICGITKGDKDMLAALQDALQHRGPDGQGAYITDAVSLGHRRLSIIDLSEGGSQPMYSGDGRYVISYNGELYNYKELRSELADQYTFRTDSDTEVLLAAYAVWGTDMLPKLRGIFAFAVWDTQVHKLFLCRDQMGVKPLYYRVMGDVLIFASELSALCVVAQPTLDTHALALYLGVGYVGAPHSLVSGVQKLPPGHYLTFADGNIEVTEYFDAFVGSESVPSMGANSIYDTIDTAVKRQLVSDRPIGLFLSGGIDSSVVLHHAQRHQDQTKSFSVEYEMVPGAETEGDKFNSDARLAERTAAHYGAQHTTYAISIQDVRDNLESAIQALDEPVANPTAIAQLLLSRWVRKDGVVVALGGDGGDELFGGYTRHRAMVAAYYYQYLPELLRSAAAWVHPKLAKLNVPPGLPLHLELMVNAQGPVSRVMRTDLDLHETVRTLLRAYYDRAPKNMSALDQFMRVDRRTWLAEESLARSDRTSMACGLELRVPLLDLDVVALSDTISPLKKTTPLTGKKVLRDAYRQHLPEYLYTQPKRGWISPGAKWFRDPVINTFCQEVFSSGYYNGLDTIINWSEARTMLNDHVEKRGYYLEPLWNLLALQIWARKYSIIAS